MSDYKEKYMLLSSQYCRDTDELRLALKLALEWIDAIPKDIQLPTMPGFDRDWVNKKIGE